jgi:hypothetical protein
MHQQLLSPATVSLFIQQTLLQVFDFTAYSGTGKFRVENWYLKTEVQIGTVPISQGHGGKRASF